MASASTSRPPSTGAPIVKLPSIHEMFPEHLVPRAASARPRTSRVATVPSPRHQFVVPPPAPAPAPQVYPSFSFEVLKSDPRSSSLEHIASSRPGAPPRRSVPRLGSSPILRAHAPAALNSPEGDADMDVDGEEGEDGEGFEFAEEGKKHICPMCSKRFNRPSSLRIHVNTHTGATPFRCPYPSCGRAFNVNSNMRRHFRNHANDNNTNLNSPTASSSSSSPSSLSFNTHSPGPSLVTSFNSPISPSFSSPPSASWSASSSRSASSFASPVTPASATFPSRNDSMFSADRWTLASMGTTWNHRDVGAGSGMGKQAPQYQYESFSQHGHGARGYGYSESDVRSDRPR